MFTSKTCQFVRKGNVKVLFISHSHSISFCENYAKKVTQDSVISEYLHFSGLYKIAN